MNERAVAVDILQEVEKGAFLNLALKKYLREEDARSRRFIAALAFTTLENLLHIDYVIGHFTQGKRIHRFIRNVLRVGVCQILFFENVPVRAAVNECVKIVGESSKRSLKGFVNAVLRNVARQAGDIVYPSREEDPAGFLSVLYSYPRWICERYIAGYGFDFAWELLAYRKPEAYTCVRPNLLRISSQDLRGKLQGRGLEITPGAYVPDCFYIKNMPSVEENYFYQKGLLAVQGEASMIVCEAAGVRPGESVLDVCAAPGGKSAYIAAKRPGLLECWDIRPHRVELMRSNFARMGVTASVAQKDAAVYDPRYADKFDVVLIDAPCSALGLLYRKPDIKYTKKAEDIAPLVSLQRRILKTCVRYVKPGGRVLYSTCTIDRRENEENMDYILGEYPWLEQQDMNNTLPAPLVPRQKEGRLQLFPHIDKVDGFFLSLLRRQL